MHLLSVSRRRLGRFAGTPVLLALAASSCSTSSKTTTGGGSTVVKVVAAENFWGSLAQQVGGSHVTGHSIINSPDADPHDYEPAAADARTFAAAQLAIINGVGYDAWATKLAKANKSSTLAVLTVGDVVGAKDGDNPHR